MEDALSVLILPDKYQKRLRTTNMAERLNQEVRTPGTAHRIFPSEDSAIRLIGALLAEQRETWSAGRRYFDVAEFLEWEELAKLKNNIGLDGDNVRTLRA